MNKRYRPNVAAIIVSPKYPEKVEIFIANRSDIPGAWQFPQGGIDDGENAKDALFRELYEEIGTNNVELIAEYPYWICYDFPDTVAQKMYPFDGQKQKYFLVRIKDISSININTEKPEFSEFKFVPIKDIFIYTSNFKKAIYKKVITYFIRNGYL